jgi:uncharacterized repeat protein (TIGR03803 family)
VKPNNLFPILVSVLSLGAMASAQAAERQILHNHVPPAATQLQPIERLSSTRRLDLALGLPLRNWEGLTNLLQQLYDPASTNYHRYLTAPQFTERFGPSEQDYQALADFARAHGLTVTGTHPNRTLLDVNASVAAIEKAFQVKLRVYQHPKEARKFFAPDAEPSLDLTVPVLAISGLDDFNLPHPMNLKTSSFGQQPNALQSTASQPAGSEPNTTAYTTGSGPRGNFLGRDFRAAYAPGVSLDGSGQAVGLFELDGYFPGDISAYKTLAGLPDVPLTNVLLNQFSGAAGPQNLEVALDIDMAIAMAPGLSKVIVYEGFTPNDVLNAMATDNQAKQLSCSWGFGKQTDAMREQIFQQFAAQGQSFYQASGDTGAWAGPIHPPSDDPFATVVGGTSLTTSGPGGSWSAETVWVHGGGGISTSYPIPPWQQGVSMAACQGSTAMRNIPDVACLADSVIWLIANNGQQGAIGGTSAAAPLWAGFTALVNQQAAINGQSSVGFVNPALYAIGGGSSYASAFHDVTIGNNTNSSSPTNFFAVAGYDLCTGWGTPTGSNLIAALLAPPDALRITPGFNFLISGPHGGPFIPLGQGYSLTNTGAASLNWSLVNTSSWLNVSTSSGTLTPGGPAVTVTLSPNVTATNLPAGSYGATLWFTNLGDHFGQSRQVTLAVVTPPVITSQPANQAVLPGTSATFTVGLAGTDTTGVFYQWQFDNGMYRTNLTDGPNITGSTTSTLTVSDVAAANVGAYSVIVSNAAGVVSSTSALLAIVPWRPQILSPPTNQTALSGQTVKLTVDAVGSQPLFYRWQQNGTNLTDGGNLSGTATGTLTISAASLASAGTYSVTVANGYGLITSPGAVLTVVSPTAPGTVLATLYSFTGGNDGANPNGLAQGANGSFYGTTQRGGTGAAGTVFQVSAAGAFSGLYSFSGGSDGATPFATLASGPDGNFYGTTFQGGAYDNGTIFNLTPSGALATLVSLNITNGDLPYAGLTLAADGNFYGTTYQGGAVGFGTVYRFSTNAGLTTLVSFTGGNDGGLLHAGLAQGADGSFYGATYAGGASSDGTLFRTTTNGALVPLYSFVGGSDGSLPYASLVRGADGNFYGTTTAGGCCGFGTVFRLSPSGLLSTLYSFTGGNDGAQPLAALIQGNDGNFYGTTVSGGAYNLGTLFRLSPDGTLATLVQFDGYNGANPQAALVQGADDSLYGAAQNGGASGQGALFRLSVVSTVPQITTQPASQAVFTGADVRIEVAVFGSPQLSYQWRENGTNLTDGGNLSGSTSRILALTNVTAANNGTYSVVISNSFGSVVSTGAVLTVSSSAPFIVQQPTNQVLNPGATVTFNVTALGNLPLLYQWRENGTNLADGGNLSGSSTSTLTISPATEANNGTYDVVVSNVLGSITSTGAVLTVIPVSAPGTRLTTLYWFSGGNDGGTPNGLVQGTNGLLYGTTQMGGKHSDGTVFSLATNGPLTTLASFYLTNGASPQAAVVQAADGSFYGTTKFGGTNFAGTVFKMTPDGTLTSLCSFANGSDGGNPLAALIQANDGNFYGTTWAENGTIFKMTPDGALTTVYAFTNGADGSSPTAALVQGRDGNFYGTAMGGALGYGTIFRMTPAGALTPLYAFTSDTDGYSPAGALVQGTDGNFYGTTTSNRIHGFQFYGTIFKISPSGVFSTLYMLNFNDGFYPHAGLVQATDGNFYGTTWADGVGGNGTLYGIAPDGTYTTLVAFDGFNDGAHPAAALIQGTDGNLYGTTTTGGPGGHGTVFKLAITSPAEIINQPASQVALVGANVTFNVTTFGMPPLFYQWRVNGTNLSDGGNIAGVATRILTLTNVTLTDAATYSVVVSNSLGSVTSTGAVLTVTTPPMFQSFRRVGNTVSLTWSGTTGLRYQLQYKTNLLAPNWANLGIPIRATSGTVSGSDAQATNTQRFYRVILR